MILHENLAAEPCVTTSDVGWIVNDDIPATKKHSKVNITLNGSGGGKGGRKLLSAAGRCRVDWNILPGQSVPETGLLSVSHRLSRKHQPV